jgi:hypothetical protein
MKTERSAFSKGNHMMFRVLRAGTGFLLTAFLFLQGMLCAEKFHSIAYAIMEQSLVLLISGTICTFLKSVPRESWVWIAVLNSLILFRRCSTNENDELESLRSAFQGDRLDLLVIAVGYYILTFFIYSTVFIRPLKKKRLLALAGTLLVLLVLNIIGLIARL